MGAVCTCAEEGSIDLATGKLSANERSTVAGGRIKESNYTGVLFCLQRTSAFDPASRSVAFLEPIGQYTDLFSYCRIVQQDPKSRPNELPYIEGGKAVLAPNLKIQLEMCLVQEIFLREEDKVALRIRLEIERPAGDYNPAANLQVISRHGRAFNGVVPKYVVNGNADVIDIGLEPASLAHNKPDQNEGNANVNIIFDEKETPKAPLKIKGIIVSTQRALLCETPQEDANIVLCEITKKGHHWDMQLPTPGGGGIDPSIP